MRCIAPRSRTVIESLDLRPYQLDALDRLRAHLTAGKRRIVLVCPTGGGKTIVAAAMVRSAVARGRSVVFVAHRKELIDQAVDKLARFGVESGVIMAQDSRRDDYRPVQVCSIQTLARRLDRLPPAQLLIYDEVHHATSNTSRKVLEAYPAAVVIGLTATPWRSDKLGLADLFEDSVLAATPAELMDGGALVRYDAFAYDAPDLHDVGMVAGDYNQRELGIACNTTILVGGVVREYLTHAGGRRAIVFPVSIAHSQALTAEFRAAGVVAAHIDCDTPKLERERILTGLASGQITVVASVGVLTEGFDCPTAEVCILARPTKSLGLYMQMIGRVLRPSPGKQRALIHDHSGNIMRHGFPDDARDYALTATPKRTRDLHTCPVCNTIFGAIRPDGTCPHCHALVQPPTLCDKCDLPRVDPEDPRAANGICECPETRREREEKRQIEGQRLDADQIRELRRKRKQHGIQRELTDAQLARAAAATREEKLAEYKRLIDVAARKGFKNGFAAHQYRAVFSVWPRFSDEQVTAAQAAVRPFIPLPRRAA